MFYVFFFSASGAHRYLHSFPTRRSSDLGFQGRRAMQPEPGLALLPEPIALALDHEGVAVMQESIEDGGGDDVVAEDLTPRSEEHTSELQSHSDLVCRLLLEKKKKKNTNN